MILILLLVHQILADNWRSDIDPKDCANCRQYYKPGSNFTSVVTYKNSIIVGGRNALYELDFRAFVEHIHLDSPGDSDDYEYCIREAGQSPIDCHNYYTLMLKISDSNLFVCGTSSFRPSCGTRTRDDLSYASAQAKVTYISSNPHSSLDYLRLRDQNYTAFVGTEQGSNTGDFVIARVNMMPGSYAMKAMTSSETNAWLNAPKFIYSFETEQYVYFVYHEIAVEISPERIYSRIARICKDDTGDTSPFFENKFLTFSKVRLQCSYSQQGQTPYQFDRISGAYYKDDYLYTAFSGGNTIIETGSVFCLFKMSKIQEAFKGKYKYWENGWWHETMPSGAPFKCGGDPNWTSGQASMYQMIAEVVKSEQVIHYSKDHLQGLDLYTTTIQDKEYKILHSGSTKGTLVRVGFHINKFGELENVRSMERRPGVGEITKIVQDESNSGDVYVISHDWITHVPLQSDCSSYSTCQTCQTTFPSCGWCISDTLRSTCTSAQHCTAGEWQSSFEQCTPLADFRIKPKNITAAHKSQIVLDCVSTTTDGTYWINETGIMSSSVVMPLNGSLIIPSASGADNGCYLCELRGVSGVVSARACVSVLIAPYFYSEYILEDGIVNVAAGDDISLPCRVGGSPKPQIIWRKIKAGSELPEGAYVSPDDGELRLIRTISEDAGEYQCNAKNSVGQNWSTPIILVVDSDTPENKPIEQDDNNTSMVSLASTVCVVLLVIIVSIVLTHCYCKRRTKQKFHQLEQQDVLPGYNTYLEPRMTPLGSLRDNSLTSVDAFRQCYSETSTPRWLPPHTIMSAPLAGDNVPPPPYQQYFMERALLNSLAHRGIYENVTHPLPGYIPGTMVQQPPSPTEQIPISFADLHHLHQPGIHHTSPGYYLPLSLNHVMSPGATTTFNHPTSPGVVVTTFNNPTSPETENTPTSPLYSTASYNMRNPMLISNPRPMLSNPLSAPTTAPLDNRAPCRPPRARSISLTSESPPSEHDLDSLRRTLPSHVYDEIVVPPGGADQRPPPVPPRPSRTPSRSPPDVPIIAEEG